MRKSLSQLKKVLFTRSSSGGGKKRPLSIPGSGFLGQDSVTFRVFDGAEFSNVATITIDAISNAPVALDVGPYSVHHTDPLWADLNGYVTNNGGGSLNFELVDIPNNGYIYFDQANGLLSYYAHSGFLGIDTFSYRVSDGADYSNVASVTIEVTNTAPIAWDGGPYIVVDEYVTITIDLNDYVYDADGDFLTFEIVDGPSHGLLTLDAATGIAEYQITPGHIGSDAFSFRVFDGLGYSVLSTVAIQTPAATISFPVDSNNYKLTLTVHTNDGSIYEETINIKSHSGKTARTATYNWLKSNEWDVEKIEDDGFSIYGVKKSAIKYIKMTFEENNQSGIPLTLKPKLTLTTGVSLLTDQQ